MKYYIKMACFLLVLPIFYSCLAHNSNKSNSDVNDLHEKHILPADTLKSDVKEDSTRMSFMLDSLSKEIIRLQSFVSADEVHRNDSLNVEIDSLSSRILTMEKITDELRNQLIEIKRDYSEAFRLPGTEAIQIKTKQSIYDCYIVDLKKTNLGVFWQDEQGRPLGNLETLQKFLNRKGHQLIFAMNAGMYKPDNSPQGLFIYEGKELAPIDREKDKYGNFYMQPNGVFFIDTTGKANLVITDKFDSLQVKKTEFATQSGPMAVINGMINKKFNKDSSSKHIRNGVGIIDDNNIVFIISNKRVNLYDFANVFKEHFKCKNALYLDGAISKMYLPELRRLQKGGDFGPIIGIYR